MNYEEHLRQLDQHIAAVAASMVHTERHILDQEARLIQKDQHGRDTRLSRELLARLRESLAAHRQGQKALPTEMPG